MVEGRGCCPWKGIFSNSSCVFKRTLIARIQIGAFDFAGFLLQANLGYMKYLTRPCSGKVCVAIESYGTEAIQHPQFKAAFPWRGGT